MSTVIQANSIVKKYGSRAVLDGASVSIAAGAKIGVVGRNGAGKSTLVRIIAGLEEPDAGTVMRHPNLRLGYLEQHESFEPGDTVMGYLERRSGKPSWTCATMAGKFQLKKALLEAPVASLSEGFRMRVRLTEMLLADPDFLLLDEPTNYLDLHTVLLLERFLRTARVGFLLVSHDREFLKNTCESTLDIERGKAFLYPGDIEAYIGYKSSEQERLERESRKMDARRRHLQSFVDRFRANSAKASQAQSRLKMLGRLKPIEIANQIRTVEIRIPAETKLKKGVALSCDMLAIGYSDRTVATNIDLDVERGRHVAVLGDNGQGKTTFLRTIAGALEPRAGTFRWGQGLEVGYYGQKTLAALDPQDRVDAYLLRSAAPGVLPEEVLAMAGSFLFGKDDVEKRIGVLSGGERARLCLAGLLLSKKPVFLLDEPTNHLDFETVEALGSALAGYPGTVFFVSHNRTFVSLFATAILELADGTARMLQGSYDEYVWHMEQEIDRDIPESTRVGAERGADPDASDKSPDAAAGREAEKQRRRDAREELREQQKRLRKVEAKVIEYEDERKRILDRMAAQPTVFSPELNRRLVEITKLLEAEEKAWLECTQAIEWLERE
jgi:ATP-binding cassette subfamily F protein 3